MEELINKILEYVEPDDEITPDSDLYNDCGLSSFDMVCLKEELYKMYGTDSRDDEIRGCRTVADLGAVFGI